MYITAQQCNFLVNHKQKKDYFWGTQWIHVFIYVFIQLSNIYYFETLAFSHFFLNRQTFSNSLSRTLIMSASTFKNVHSLERKIGFSVSDCTYLSTFLKHTLSGRNADIWGKWVFWFACLKTYPIVRHPGVVYSAVLSKSCCAGSYVSQIISEIKPGP